METVLVTLNTGLVNVFFVVGARTVIIDAGYPGAHEKILEELQRREIAADQVSLLLLSHGHIDHFGGAARLQRALKVPILAHRLAAPYLRRGENAPMRLAPTVSQTAREAFLGRVNRMRAEPIEPDILVDDEADLGEYGVDLRVIHTPGHSPGSLSMQLPDGQVILADLVGETRVPPTRASLPLFFDDAEQLKHSIDRVLGLDAQQFFASHGGPFSAAQIRALMP